MKRVNIEIIVSILNELFEELLQLIIQYINNNNKIEP